MTMPVGRIDSGTTISSPDVRSNTRPDDVRADPAVYRPDVFDRTRTPAAESADLRAAPDAPKVELVANRARSQAKGRGNEPFYEPPTSIAASRGNTVRADDRMEAFQGRTGERARANLEEARKSVDAHAPVLQKALTDRADRVAATNPQLAARLRQSATDLPHVTLGMLGVESNFGTGVMNIPRDGPLQVNGTAQKEAAAALRGVDPSLASVSRTTVSGGVQAAMAHLTSNLMQDRFDGDLRRAVSQFNGGNADGMAFTRPGPQNGYVAAAYALGHRLPTEVPRP